MGVGEQVAWFLDGFASGGQVQVGGAELFLDAGLLFGELPDFAAEFVLGPVGVADEVEVGVFLGFQCGQPFGELAPDLGLGAVPVCHGAAASGLDERAEIFGQAHGGVVAHDFVFYLVDGKVGQVAGVFLAASAQVVEVEAAVVALAAHDDQPPSASCTP